MFVPGLSEAEAVRLINLIMFGHTAAPIARPAYTPLRRRRMRAPRSSNTRMDDIYSAGNDEFFRTIVLKKRPARRPATPAAPSHTHRHAAAPKPAPCPSFPRGLCYLVGVAPADRGAAMLQLGSYPTVNALLNSWLFSPSKVHLIPQRVGLFHAVDSPTETSIPVTLCNGDWNVGADHDFPYLPRHPRNDMGPPPARPRGPPPRYFDNDPRGPRPSDNTSRPPRHDTRPVSRGLPDRGAYRGRGRGRITDPSPFQVQFNDDQRGRDAPRAMPCETWEDANVT